ncbi:gamma carbonic anhydrase family protein [Salinigranum halophilum]|uniref:gamma carbonic anhydrase family protein n=1 Tax=Salinigranum halophilum TaxID=2565931 RepID=UPI00191C5B12|nr:gamma carbonic anhydrase family protein [Salinigranum halophilum]
MSHSEDALRESLFGHTPVVADSAFVSRLSYLVGEVAVGERASLWPFTCLRGDGGSGGVIVGDETNVQEFSMLHGADIGNDVTVGHSVVVDYATVEDHSLVGMNSCVLRDAIVESNCIVAAGAVVLQGQTVPEGHLAYGAPAQTKPLSDDQRDEIDRVHEHYVELSRGYKETGRFE